MNDMKRKTGMRYKTEDQPVYAEFYAKFKNASDILTPSGNLNSTSKVYDKRGIQSALYNLCGDDKGRIKVDQYTDGLSLIPDVEEQIRNLHWKYEDYCERREREGFEVPDKMPPEMHNDLMKLQARLDVYNLEKEALEQRLSEIQSVANTDCLKFGPVGSGQLQNGDLVEIDGQRVERINGKLVITEPGSPYLGMAVVDYRKLVSDPWLKQQNDELNALVNQRKKDFQEKGFSNVMIPSRRKAISKESLPKWPEGCINHLIEEHEQASK